mgnify:CR=1 FL=1
MSTTQHTSHYNLPTFGDNPNDRPSWRGDFTDAMNKIDNQMYANATNITTATAAANNANTAAQQAKASADNAAALAQTNKTGIAELNGYFSKLGVTSPQTAQNLINTINGKAENTDLTALQGTVSTLSGKVDTKANASEVYTRSQADARYTQQGGYAGTAQTLNTNIENLKKNGVAPVQFMNATINALGIKGTISGYYSPIAHLATLRFDYKGTLTGELPDVANGGVKVATVPEGYRVSGQPINFFHDAQPLTNPANAIGYMFFILKPDGSINLAGAYSVHSGNAIAATAIMAYYVL